MEPSKHDRANISKPIFPDMVIFWKGSSSSLGLTEDLNESHNFKIEIFVTSHFGSRKRNFFLDPD